LLRGGTLPEAKLNWTDELNPTAPARIRLCRHLSDMQISVLNLPVFIFVEELFKLLGLDELGEQVLFQLGRIFRDHKMAARRDRCCWSMTPDGESHRPDRPRSCRRVEAVS
jgi:hypothetical protein